MNKNIYQYDKEKVSIVTPVYNGESHLSKMLDSVLHQTYGQIDMILVDDGSTDGTVKVAESYYDRFSDRGYRFRIVQTEHKCASAAINRGLPYVSGEYLIWPDSDDVLEPESVQKRVEFLQQNLQYNCVRSLSYYFNAETGELSDRADEKRGDLSREDIFWDILESKTFVCCGCYMLRAEKFFEIYPDRHIPEYNVGQNFQMLLPFMYFNRCYTIQEQLYGVYIREGSHSRRILTETEELQKYRYYEELVDDIAGICHIKDRKEIKRLNLWKARRRRQIALKYGRQLLRIDAAYQLYRYGEFNFQQLKEELTSVYRQWKSKSRRPNRKAKQKVPEKFEVDRVDLCGRKRIALTFDAAWGNQYTKQILEKLKTHHAKATFFVNGASIKICPEDNRSIFLDGHEIGNYTYSYPHMLEMSEDKVLTEIRQTQQLIKEITGENARLFRFPYGESSERLCRLVNRNGLTAVSWAIDSLDWQDISSEQIYRNVIDNNQLENGIIIRMNRSGKRTPDALELILPELKRQGYEVVSVSDLLNQT